MSPWMPDMFRLPPRATFLLHALNARRANRVTNARMNDRGIGGRTKGNMSQQTTRCSFRRGYARMNGALRCRAHRASFDAPAETP